MNLTNDIELSILFFLLYVILRTGTRSFMSEERGTGTALGIIILGSLILLVINSIIGTITILIGALLLLTPRKKGDLENDK